MKVKLTLQSYEQLPQIRTEIRSFLSQQNMDEVELDKLFIAIEELIQNALEHSNTEKIEISLRSKVHSIEVRVKNGKVAEKNWSLEPRKRYLKEDPDTNTLLVRGNGLRICQAFSDHMYLEQGKLFTAVRMIKNT